jgi:hypothetical protein
MALKVVPLVPSRNQTLVCTLPVDNKNITLQFTFTYNGVGGYWWMSITEMPRKTLLVDSVPLVTGLYPAGDLLRQYGYLEIGSAYIVPASDGLIRGIPDFDNLGVDYFLYWNDTVQ